MYLTTGGWGAPLYNDEHAKEWWVARSSETYHFVLVDLIENGTLRLQAKDDTGATFDEVWVQKASSRIGMDLTASQSEKIILSTATSDIAEKPTREQG